MTGIPSRWERTRAALEQLDCAQLLATGPDHVTHLAGYNRYLAGPSAVILRGGGQQCLIVPRPELDIARESSTADDVLGYGTPDLLDLDPEATMLDFCSTLLAPGAVALAGPGGVRARSHDQLAGATAFDTQLEEIRLVKDRDELERIRRSSRLCLDAQDAVGRRVMVGADEIDGFNAAQSAAQTIAGTPVEFICTVASGARAAMIGPPRMIPAHIAPDHGDGVLVDIAVRDRGYWGDSARTYVFGHNDQITSAVAVLAEIKEAAARRLVPGTRAAAIFDFVRDELARAFPGNVLSHHAGHGIGIGVGEAPQLLPGNDALLRENMVIALEPSFYVAGQWGARVEDVYRVTADGGRILISDDEDDA